MANYFFDTSALVKRHVNETGSSWVKSLVRAKAGHRVYIARITTVKLTSAITRRQHAGDLSAAQAGAILGHFRRHLTQYYRIIELTPAPLCRGDAGSPQSPAQGLRCRTPAVVLEVHRLQPDAGLGPVTLVSVDRDLNTAATTEGLAVEDTTMHP